MNDLLDNKILVTGGGGFLGGFVIDELVRCGVKIEDISIPRSSKMDLRVMKNCEKAVKGIDYVIHLAATVGGIGFNKKNPASLFYDNMIMGTQLMDASMRAGIKKFVQLGTVCAYPNLTPVPFSEEAIWDGYPEKTNAPYGIAKKALLVQAQAYRQQYGFNAIYLLPVNLYGPNDNFDLQDSHVIPALIRKCVEAKLAGEEMIVLWGTGKPTREFLYVEDCARGIVLALLHYNNPDPINLGSGEEISIRDLFNTIAEITEYTGAVTWDSKMPDGQPRRSLETSRAKSFGFTAAIDFREGLERTISWYMENMEKIG